MKDDKIARWWNSVKDELCWSGAVRGQEWEALVETFTADVIESIRNVYRKARRMI